MRKFWSAAPPLSKVACEVKSCLAIILASMPERTPSPRRL
jgi:hypothetical protein